MPGLVQTIQGEGKEFSRGPGAYLRGKIESESI